MGTINIKRDEYLRLLIATNDLDKIREEFFEKPFETQQRCEVIRDSFKMRDNINLTKSN